MAGGGINETEVNGVRTFWCDTPGPLRAGLVFRVGIVDETLTNHGITHLVEHMMLRAADRGALAFNGVVEPLRTAFTVSGDEPEATRFITSIARDIGALARKEFSLERLDLERQVLLTEAAGRGGDALSGLLAYRWGPRGIGLSSYDELGLHTVDDGDLADWAQRFFAVGNAALWMTRPPPDDLELGLPAGERTEPAPVEPLDLPTPGWFARPTRTIACGMTLERSFAASALAGALDERLRKRIRHDLGLSYEVVASYLPYSADRAHLALFADSLPDNAPKVREALHGAIEETSREGDLQQELDAYRAAVRQAWNDPASIPAKLDQEATRSLVTPRVESHDLVAELDRLEGPEVADALREALPTALYLIGAEDKMPDLTKVPEFSDAAVSGKRYALSQRRAGQMRGGARHQRLVVGEEGASLLYTKNKKITVRFAEAEALTRWSDGSICLFGSDGFTLVIRPEDWRFGRKAVEKVEQRFPGETVAMSGEGPPSPLATSFESPRSALGFAALASFIALGSAINLIAPDPGNDDGVSRLIAAAFTIGFIILAVFQVRRYLKAKEEQ